MAQQQQFSMAKIGRRWHGHGGRQNSRARWLMIPRLRVRGLFTLFRRCLQALKKGSRLKEEDGGGRLWKKKQQGYYYSSTSTGGEREFKLRPWYRSNSFYAEAIADCLEFIKRNSTDNNTSCSSSSSGSSSTA